MKATPSSPRQQITSLVLAASFAIAFIHEAKAFEPSASGKIKGWYLSGDARASYSSDVDVSQKHDGKPVAYLKFSGSDQFYDPKKFGTLMQNIDADNYRTKRVRFAVSVKTNNVDRCGPWLRINSMQGVVAFDGMTDRPIKGTTDWKRYAIVLDVPEKAEEIAFGVLLAGKGQVLMSDASFEPVGKDVPTTGDQFSKEPVNMDFSQPQNH
jgi:hypothetical protein